MTTLRKLRQKSQRDPRELASAAGLTLPAYYDLESCDDELRMTVSVAAIADIARVLGVKPSVLLGTVSTQEVSLEDVSSALRAYVARVNKPLSEIEAEIGWAVGGAMHNPEELRELNADGLIAVCESIGVDWRSALDGLA